MNSPAWVVGRLPSRRSRRARSSVSLSGMMMFPPTQRPQDVATTVPRTMQFVTTFASRTIVVSSRSTPGGSTSRRRRRTLDGVDEDLHPAGLARACLRVFAHALRFDSRVVDPELPGEMFTDHQRSRLRQRETLLPVPLRTGVRGHHGQPERRVLEELARRLERLFVSQLRRIRFVEDVPGGVDERLEGGTAREGGD